MVGTVPLESAVVFEASLPSYLDEGLDFLELDLFMTALVTQTGYENFDAIYEALEEFYLQDHNYSDPMSNLHRFCNMMTDFAFESPKGTVLGALGEYGVETYHYHFMKRSDHVVCLYILCCVLPVWSTGHVSFCRYRLLTTIVHA